MSSEYKIIYSSESLTDLIDIYNYISFDLLSPEVTVRHNLKIRNKIKTLSLMPERYQLVDWESWRSIKMRSLPIDNFIVFYLVNDKTKTVSIVRIFYAGRNIENIINKA